ncbi:streptophobe family protein [Streptomyces parvulus]|uniref:streptophobe family protein n=1 Tax=Streptomyces parvulus TaxID=146923 RepID=UPI003F4DA726
MSASTSAGSGEHGAGVPWGDVVMSAIASVSWALIGMAGTAALGLHLLGADAAGSLGPMTAAVVALGAGGSVTPSGDVSAFGLKGAEAFTAIEITPLGVSLVGALLLSFFFLRSLRGAGVEVSPAELLARAGAVVALFVAMAGGLVWAGHDVVTIDGASLGMSEPPGAGGGGGLEIPGLGDVGDAGGLLPDRIGDLVGAEAAVGIAVDAAPTLLGGLAWSAGVLLIALLASRRTPLPRGCAVVHRVVRPAVSAVVTVALTAVAAGVAAAAYAAVGDAHPRRIAGAALLGAPNGAWLGVPVGLGVPWDGRAGGALVEVLPAPLDELLGAGGGEPVTLARLAELDGRVWLLGVAAALMMLLAGILTAVRTPLAPGGTPPPAFVGHCALRLGVATALALPLLSGLTRVTADASLSVLGIDTFGASLDLRAHLGTALLLGALWGAAAGAAGALLARASGAAGVRATWVARGAGFRGGGGRGVWRARGWGRGVWRPRGRGRGGSRGRSGVRAQPGVPGRTGSRERTGVREQTGVRERTEVRRGRAPGAEGGRRTGRRPRPARRTTAGRRRLRGPHGGEAAPAAAGGVAAGPAPRGTAARAPLGRRTAAPASTPARAAEEAGRRAVRHSGTAGGFAGRAVRASREVPGSVPFRRRTAAGASGGPAPVRRADPRLCVGRTQGGRHAGKRREHVRRAVREASREGGRKSAGARRRAAPGSAGPRRRVVPGATAAPARVSVRRTSGAAGTECRIRLDHHERYADL